MQQQQQQQQQQQAMERKIMLSELESIKKFASSYVASIIEEAIKQSSSKNSWLIHCSENCHQINIVQRNQCNSFLFWTPEEESNEDTVECGNNSTTTTITTTTTTTTTVKEYSALKCQQFVDDEGKKLDEDLYSLPADTITIYGKEAENGSNSSSSSSSSSRCFKMSNHNCLKPKAYHALSLLKSHHKTLNDLKLFLINLYSSNDLAVKKIGSDHSAFTRYYKRINGTTSSSTDSVTRRPFSSPNNVGDDDDDVYQNCEDYVLGNEEKKNESAIGNITASCASSTAFYQKREENRNILRLKNENSAVRKCSKIKRRNFFNIKRSFRKVFRSSATDAKERSQSFEEDEEEEEEEKVACRSLQPPPPPPLPPCHLNRPKRTLSIGKSGSGDGDSKALAVGKETSMRIDVGVENTYLDVSAGKEGKKDVECVMNGDKLLDFVSNIEKVKDHGWYWGPMTREAAEKLLTNEPDGSFIVRDSSDDRYIFSLTFKLNSCIRHVRIEHGQGNFSFGNYTKFKSQTIVDFIENAIQHSKSGRYLFFLHHRPILGPMRVQLLYPVSRFKYVQSLQHSCRFVILKSVRKDLIPLLPLPKSLIEYLNSKDYYTEQRF